MEKTTYIGFKATQAEILLLKRIMLAQNRKTKADTIRALLLKEAQKI